MLVAGYATFRVWAEGQRDDRQPADAIVVMGAAQYDGRPSPVFAARHELLTAWLPAAEPFILPGANHLLHAQNPAAMAGALADFFGRHPTPDPGRSAPPA